jgi:hypothetical protein
VYYPFFRRDSEHLQIDLSKRVRLTFGQIDRQALDLIEEKRAVHTPS